MTQSRAGWLCSHCGHIEATKTPLPPLPNQPAEPETTSVPEPFRAKAAPIVGGGSNSDVKDEDLLAVDQILAKFGEHSSPTGDTSDPEPELEPKAAAPAATTSAARSKARAKGIAATDMHLSVAGITAGPETTFTGPSPVAALEPPPPPPPALKSEESKPEFKPEPKPEPAPDPEPEAEVESEPEAESKPESTPVPEHEPKPEPKSETEPDPKSEPKSETEPDPKSEPHSEPTLVPASPLGPNPEPLETPAHPEVPAPVADNAPAVPAVKAPLTPETHPKPVDHKTVIASIIAGFVLILVGLTAYFALATPGRPFAMLLPATPTPTPAPTVTATPEPTPTATPVPTATTRDADRKVSFGKYLTAYRATISNGYYAVTPPTVSASQTDPTTGKAYVIATELPTASVLGTLYYLPGYQCTNEQTATKQSNPGRTSTRYVALATYLEATGKLYCQNINQ